MTRYYIAGQGVGCKKSRSRAEFLKGATEIHEPKPAFAIDGYYADEDTEDMPLIQAWIKGAVQLGGKITIDKKVMAGTPVITGTRIPVFVILDYLGEGHTPKEIIEDYPSLTLENVKDALKFASAVIDAHED
ncbi:MAG TPA: DUF433 domain-containing protein [Spirochaetia bacterium]|nr:DUF433 domain-containing protein [Spirochaetia bacterium]